MLYQVKIKPSAEKNLKRFPIKDQIRIKSALIKLALNPYIGKKLKGEYKGLYSLRVWPYRIIYTIYQKELLIFIIRIGQRQGVY